VAPAFSFIARSPSVPSEPIPESTTPILLVLVLGKRAEEEVIGSSAPGRCLGQQVQGPVKNRQSLLENQVDVVDLDPQSVLGLKHR